MKAVSPPIESILSLLREAGTLVRTMQSHISLSVKQDGTVVTEADISSHNLLSKTLAKLTPDIPVLSEEQPLADNMAILTGSTRFWAIDPLDVTANYAAGGKVYSINIALVENGMPTRGALYFPGIDELYFTGDDGKAYFQAQQQEACVIHVPPVQEGKTTVAVRPNSHVTHAPLEEQTLNVIFTRGQRRACLVATGEATFCSERAGFYIWDSAATYAIVSAAGGALEQHDGSPVCYNHSLELPAYFVGHPALLCHLHAVQPEQAPTEIPITPNKRKKA